MRLGLFNSSHAEIVSAGNRTEFKRGGRDGKIKSRGARAKAHYSSTFFIQQRINFCLNLFQVRLIFDNFTKLGGYCPNPTNRTLMELIASYFIVEHGLASSVIL